jgi:hypothetical protein
MRPMTIGEVRLDTAKAARFRASALSTGCLRRSPAHAKHDLPLPKGPEAAIIAEIHPESGECWFNCVNIVLVQLSATRKASMRQKRLHSRAISRSPARFTSSVSLRD